MDTSVTLEMLRVLKLSAMLLREVQRKHKHSNPVSFEKPLCFCARHMTMLFSLIQFHKQASVLKNDANDAFSTGTLYCYRNVSLLACKCSAIFKSDCGIEFCDETLYFSKCIQHGLIRLLINNLCRLYTCCMHCEHDNEQWHLQSTESKIVFFEDNNTISLTLCGGFEGKVFTVLDLGQTSSNTIYKYLALAYSSHGQHMIEVKLNDKLCKIFLHIRDSLNCMASMNTVLFESRVGLSGHDKTLLIESRLMMLEMESLNCNKRAKQTCGYTQTELWNNSRNDDQLSIQETCQSVYCDFNVIEEKLRKISSKFDNVAIENMEISLQELNCHKILTRVSNQYATQNLVSLSEPKKDKCTQSYYDLNNHVGIIRGLTWLPLTELPVQQVDVIVGNVLDPLFPRMINGQNLGPRVTMKFELLRLCTFRNFPKENKPYLIRLAGAGFYYAADGDEVVCYCCGIRRRNWTADCKPMRIHRRISPNCSFLTRNSEVNIPVPAGTSEDMTKFAFLRNLIEEEEELGDNDSGYDSDSLSSRAQRAQGSTNTATHLTSTRQGQSENKSISRPPPKHPHYGVLSTRQNSFVGWEGGNGQEPETLADAGFYFAGMGDCVRCFQCGVGLRHWAPGDDPWIEHARWTLRSGCAYLIQKKGQEFVDLVRMAIEVTNNEPDPQSIDAPEDHASSGDRNVQLPDVANSQQTEERQAVTSRGPENVATTCIPTAANQITTNQSKSTDETVKSNAENVNSKDSKAGGMPKKTIKRKDLSEEQKSLLEENSRLRDEKICKVCFERDVCIVFLPCGHLVTCAECAPVLRICPICRKVVKGTVKTFMS